jgi:hypothetical protein
MTEEQGVELVAAVAELNVLVSGVGQMCLAACVCVGWLVGLKAWEIVRYALRAKEIL